MREAIPPLPNTPSWRGAQLKHRDNFTFTFTISFKQFQDREDDDEKEDKRIYNKEE
jgi:hypothetical protein